VRPSAVDQLKTRIEVGWDADSIITAYVSGDSEMSLDDLLQTLEMKSGDQTLITYDKHSPHTAPDGVNKLFFKYIDGNHRMSAVDALLKEGANPDNFDRFQVLFRGRLTGE
jgi:hypothetical protein